MSVTAQHLDYLKTALKTLEVSSENQYKIRGQPQFDKVSKEVQRSTSCSTPISTIVCFQFYTKCTVNNLFFLHGLIRIICNNGFLTVKFLTTCIPFDFIFMH